MLQLTKLRDLTLQASSSPGRAAFISAASGLVRVGAQLYVVADDELHLARFSLEHDAQGEVNDTPRILDASALFAELAQHFAQLNLEGAWVWGNDLCLLQRGNKGDAINAVIRLDLQELMMALTQGDVLPTLTPLAVQTIQLGTISGIATRCKCYW